MSVMLLLLITCTLFTSVRAADGCDWFGSGLEHDDSASWTSDRGVHPVYLRCRQGSVTWLYPRGALRVVLRYATAGKEFQGCLKLSSEFSGANIYVERHRVLKLLHSSSASASSLGGSAERPDARRHCFHSHQGQVALFLEADANAVDALRKQVASFDYDLQVQPDADSSDPWEECRPCTVQETLDMFCSSDFVARGTISAIFNDDQLDRTLLTVRATRVIRQVSAVFRSKRSPSEEDHHVATLHVPRRCQAKHGSGEFVFMGRQRLGDAILWCAPRLEEWQHWIQQDHLQQSAQCRLQS